VDGGGASLVPCGPLPAALDDRALAGLLFREGARAVVRQSAPPAGETARKAAAELALCGRGAAPPDARKAGRYLVFIGRRALDGEDRRIFRETWEGALAEAGRGAWRRGA
jgi:hypothetical protein